MEQNKKSPCKECGRACLGVCVCVCVCVLTLDLLNAFYIIAFDISSAGAQVALLTQRVLGSFNHAIHQHNQRRVTFADRSGLLRAPVRVARAFSKKRRELLGQLVHGELHGDGEPRIGLGTGLGQRAGLHRRTGDQEENVHLSRFVFR